MISTVAGGVLIDVRVIPRAGRAGIAGTRDGALLVRINKPPVDGGANAELVELIARTLGVARRDVEIVSGARARDKRLRVRDERPQTSSSSSQGHRERGAERRRRQ